MAEEGVLEKETNNSFLELPLELKECPEKAQEYFNQGNELYIKGDLRGAFSAYRMALKFGFPDKEEIVEIMNDVRILLGELPKRNHDGSNMPTYGVKMCHG